jgi:hypothetical protein
MTLAFFGAAGVFSLPRAAAVLVTLAFDGADDLEFDEDADDDVDFLLFFLPLPPSPPPPAAAAAALLMRVVMIRGIWLCTFSVVGQG